MNDKPCMRCAYGEYFTDCDQELLLRAEKSEKRIAEFESNNRALEKNEHCLEMEIAELKALLSNIELERREREVVMGMMASLQVNERGNLVKDVE